MSGKGISGIVALLAASLISGIFAGAAFINPPPVDETPLYCNAATTGWVAAHVNLYTYVQRTDPELFNAQFKPITPQTFQSLLTQCLDDVNKTREALNALVAKTQPAPLGGGTGK